MIDLKVSLQSDVCSPGQTLKGEVAWSANAEGGKSVSIRLIWFTEGKGDRDYKMVDSIEVPLSSSSAGTPFEFVVPHRPLSFSGRLISLKWAVEAVAMPFYQSELAEFKLTIDSAEITLSDKSDQLKGFGMRNSFFSKLRTR